MPTPWPAGGWRPISGCGLGRVPLVLPSGYTSWEPFLPGPSRSLLRKPLPANCQENPFWFRVLHTMRLFAEVGRRGEHVPS